MTINTAKERWNTVQTELPLIAILRGITPTEILAVAEALYTAGFRCLEVPLNSPDAITSIEQLAQHYGDKMLVGAGTVLTVNQVNQCAAAGAKLIVAPNLSANVASAAIAKDCVYCPGVATPTEAFQALEMGATGLKLFPAELVNANVVKAIRAVLPQDACLIPVGGITPNTMNEFTAAGANGFGLGSGLYKSGKSLEALASDAAAYVSAWRSLPSNN